MLRFLPFLFFLLFPGGLFAFWPLYWDLDGQKNLFGPLVTYEEENGRTHLTLRPLLSTYDSPRTYRLLFPFGKSTGEKAYFFPVYTRHKGEDGHDVGLFPVFWGESGEKSYGGVFPLYGKLYNRYRRDEIGFFLWPLYSYSTGDGTTRTNVVWPLFSFYEGYQQGFKIGPLYGQRTWGSERKSTFVLWPFFIKDEKGLDTDQPVRSHWAIPFYMQTKSPQSSFYAVLWPFFTYTKTNDRKEIKAPWPVFSYSSGKEEEAFSLWPLYSHSRTEKDEVTYVLWPIYKGTDRFPGDGRMWTEKRILLLDKYTLDDRGKYLNVWPLFEYRAAGESRDFFFPSLMPWRNAEFDRIVKPMLTLYEFRKTEDKVISNFLYGFYTKEQKGEAWKRRLAFLFEVKREPEGMGFQFLSGLFAIDHARVKLFYIPIDRGPEVKQAAAGEDVESTGDSEADPQEQWQE